MWMGGEQGRRRRAGKVGACVSLWCLFLRRKANSLNQEELKLSIPPHNTVSVRYLLYDISRSACFLLSLLVLPITPPSAPALLPSPFPSHVDDILTCPTISSSRTTPSLSIEGADQSGISYRMVPPSHPEEARIRLASSPSEPDHTHRFPPRQSSPIPIPKHAHSGLSARGRGDL